MQSVTANVRRPAGLILILLLLVNILNFVDRQLPFILAEAIRADLRLSDTQIGLMGGATFAVFYAFVSLPAASIADRWSAKWSLVLCIAIWSATTALGGLATSFVALAVARIGVAIGEAGCTPAGHALISGAFPPERRGFAIGTFAMGAPLGIMVGLVLGGWLSDVGNWRIAFALVGLPGLALAVLFALLAPDPRPARNGTPALSFVAAARLLFAQRSYRHLTAAMTLFGISGYGMFAFGAPYFIRVHGYTATQAGLALGLLNGGSGIVGALSGGAIADWLGARDRRHAIYVVAAGFALSAPLAIAGWLASSPGVSLAFLLVPTLCNIFYSGPCFSTCQALAPARARAAASAIPLFGQSLIGASVGPVAVGFISDHLKADYGTASLRYALCATALVYLLTAFFLVRAARTLREDVARVAANGPIAVST